ncbi:MAG TPA: EamA family transporter [Steroidobacteraceae bacterium]|nr:EamA family transporter [Steroidobacteraceae bacterium]
MNAPRQRRLLVLCLSTVYLVWGTSYLATRIGVLSLPPFLFGGVRFLLGGTLLMTVAFWRGFRPAQLAGQWRHLHVLALLGVALCNGAQVWAMQWVPSHASALLNASSAMWIVLFGLWGWRAHRPQLRALAGLAIGFAGTVLLVWPSRDAAAAATATPLLPQLVILAGCVVWSMSTVYMRNHSLHLDLFALVGMPMLMGGTWLVLAGVLRGEVSQWHWNPPGLFALGYLVVLSSCFAYTAYAWLARHATPAQTGTYSYVNPALAAVVGYLVLGETLTPLQAMGAVVILAGVLLINWPERSGAAAPDAT